MTTSHKPTYHPAIGRANAGGYRYDVARAQFSSREMPSHMVLKERRDLVGKAADQAALKAALQAAEGKHKQGIRDERSRQGILDDADDEPVKAEAAVAIEEDAQQLDPGTVDLSKFDDSDDAPPADNGRGAASGGDDSDDESDEEAELARELDLIRRERDEAKLKAAEAEAAEAEAAAFASLHSNPLMPMPAAAAHSSAPFASASAASSSSTDSASLKRRWDDDVVFKNQAKGDLVNKPKKRFINDTIRSDFHRSFLNRYIQ